MYITIRLFESPSKTAKGDSYILEAGPFESSTAAWAAAREFKKADGLQRYVAKETADEFVIFQTCAHPDRVVSYLAMARDVAEMGEAAEGSVAAPAPVAKATKADPYGTYEPGHIAGQLRKLYTAIGGEI